MKNHRWLFLVVGAFLLGGLQYATAEGWKLRAPSGGTTFFADDATLGFGNTSGSPDTKIGWETTGTDHLSLVAPADTCTVLSSDADVDRAGVTCTDTRLCVCSDAEGNPDQCICTYHDETSAILDIPDGQFQVNAASGIYDMGSGTSATQQFFRVRGTENTYLGTQTAAALTSLGWMINTNRSHDESRMALGDTAGYFMGIVHESNLGVDTTTAQQADPHWKIYGRTSPASDADRWMGMIYKDGAGEQYGKIHTGEGDISIEPASGYVRHMRRWVGPCTVSHDGGTHTCFTVAAGDVVTKMLFNVTEVWDGSDFANQVTFGDGSDGDGIGLAGAKGASGDRELGSTGWNWYIATSLGAYLTQAGMVRMKVYAVADTIDAFATNVDATQGEGQLYVEMSRLP